MLNLIEIGFGNDKSRSKKNPNTKIYENGNIIISRPQSSKNPYTILSIKKYKSSSNLKIHKNLNKSYTKKNNKNSSQKHTNKKPKYKTIKKSVEEMHKKIKKEIDEMNEDEMLTRNIGYILRNTFTKDELENIIDFGPSPKLNRIKLSNNVKKEVIKQKIKPYTPNIETSEPKIINERYLQNTINIYKDNEFVINKINEMLKNSNFINEEKIKEEKERKKLKIDKEKKQIREFIKNKRKEIKQKSDNDNNKEDDTNNTNFNFQIEDLNADNVGNNKSNKNTEDKKDKKEEIIKNKINNNKNSKKKNNIKKNDNNYDFIKIVDISKDKKYIDAEIRLKRTKENCEKAEELALEIEQKIKEDKKIMHSPEYIISKKQKNNVEEKAKHIIEEVKSNIDISNFAIKKLNKEDQKLIKGGKRYDPNKREKNQNKKDIPINKNNEPILVNSINSVKQIKEINKDFNNIFKKNNAMDDKEKNISQKWKNDNECVKAYINNFNKAQRIDINKVKKEKNINLESKNDICNYMYLPRQYDEHWYNNKDTKDKTEYRHPFLIYDD